MTPVAKVSVSFHLTPFAPVVAGVDLADRQRWMVMWSVPAVRAFAELAQRLRTHPSRLSIHEGRGGADDHDDIEIRGPASGFAGDQVLALIAAGLTGDEARAALEQLQQAVAAQAQKRAA